MRKALLILAMAFSVGSHAAIVVGDTSSTSGSASSFSLAHDVAGADTFLIVGFYFRDGVTESNIQYNSVAMTKIGSTVSAGDIDCVLYFLDGPTDGTHNLTGDLSASKNFGVGAVTYTGVDSIGNSHNATSSFVTIIDLTITASVVNSMLVTVGGQERGTGTFTEQPEMTSRWAEQFGNAANGANGAYADRLITTAQDYPLGWTLQFGDQNVMIAAELIEVSKTLPPRGSSLLMGLGK